MSKQDSEFVINDISSFNQQKWERKKSQLPDSLTQDEQQKASP